MVSRLWALVQLSYALLLGGLCALRFLLKAPTDRLRRARAVLKGRAHPHSEAEMLLPASEGLHRIDPGFLEAPGEGHAGSMIVIYFTGTGETPHAPLPTYRALLASASGLAGLRHYVVEVGSSRVDLQACKLEYSIVSPK